MKAKKTLVLSATFVIAIIAAISFFSSVNIIQTGEVGIVRRLGVVTEVLHPGGLNLRLSWIHTIDIYDMTVREADLDFTAYSIDAQNVRGHVSIQYQLNPETMMQVAAQFGPLNMLESRLHAMLLQETQNVFALKSAMELVEGRAYLSHEIWQRISAIAPNFHISITNVALEGMIFSAAFEQAVEQRAIADQLLRQAELDAARDLVYAQRALDVSRLEAESVLVQARADAESLEIMQAAWGELGLEVRDAMLRQMFFEQWDGVLPNVLTGENLSLIMDGLSIGE